MSAVGRVASRRAVLVSNLQRPTVWRRHVRREADDYLRPFLLTIAEYADTAGTVRRCTRAQLAEDLAKTERTVQRWIGRAVDDGWLVVLVRGQKHVSAQVYGLTLPASQGDTSAPVRETLRETPPRSLRTPVQGDTCCLPHKNRASVREHVAVDRTAGRREDHAGRRGAVDSATKRLSDTQDTNAHTERKRPEDKATTAPVASVPSSMRFAASASERSVDLQRPTQPEVDGTSALSRPDHSPEVAPVVDSTTSFEVDPLDSAPAKRSKRAILAELEPIAADEDRLGATDVEVFRRLWGRGVASHVIVSEVQGQRQAEGRCVWCGLGFCGCPLRQPTAPDVADGSGRASAVDEPLNAPPDW